MDERLDRPSSAEDGRWHGAHDLPAGRDDASRRARDGSPDDPGVRWRRGEPELEHRLDQADQVRVRSDGDAVQLRDGGGQREIGDVDGQDLDGLRYEAAVECGDIGGFKVHHARILAERAEELPEPGVHRIHARGARLEEDSGEATGSRTEVEAGSTRNQDIET